MLSFGYDQVFLFDHIPLKFGFFISTLFINVERTEPRDTFRGGDPQIIGGVGQNFAKNSQRKIEEYPTFLPNLAIPIIGFISAPGGGAKS